MSTPEQHLAILRKEAGDALGELFALVFTGATAEQMSDAAEAAVAAQTRHTLAHMRLIS